MGGLMEEYSQKYPVWLCDIWGVVHNGVKPYIAAVAALSKHRRSGGTVILVTNSPRSRLGVRKQLAEIGVDPGCFDEVVTSGDVTRELIAAHGGGSVYHLGPERDLSIFKGLDVARTELKDAKAILCTGLFDDANDTLEDYAALLRVAYVLKLPMICANPDKIVRHGDRILYCAGSLAEIYQAMGGEVMMAGKPYQPIYDLALAEATRICGQPVRKDHVLAIGDGPETDIRGAANFGVDVVLVADGVTDATAGLAAVEHEVAEAVPEARIVLTVRNLVWP